MFILKKSAANDYSENATLEWAVVPNDTIAKIWDDVISIYRKYFEDHAKDSYDKLVENPAIYIDDPSNLKNYTDFKLSVYYTNKTPKIYRLISEDEYNEMIYKIANIFKSILNNRIQELLFNRHGNFAKFNPVLKNPFNIDQVRNIIENHNPNDNHLVFMFHRECNKVTPEILREVMQNTHELGFAFNAALQKKDAPRYHKLLQKLSTINHNNQMRLSKWKYPPTLQLYQNKPNHVAKKFRLCAYQDGVLVFERRGNLVNYAWIDMLDKLLNKTRKYNGGAWVFVIGIIDVINE